MASALYETADNISEYFKDRKVDTHKLKTSSTLYIGNLSFFTTESQIYEYFSRCGEVSRVIMGLNKNTKTPCGFCFVEFFTREDAANAVNYLNNTYLDGRIIRVDWDPGFLEGRQFGRGYSGGQRRDEMSDKMDPDRPKGEQRFTGQKRPYRDDYKRNDSRDNYRDRDSRGDSRDHDGEKRNYGGNRNNY